MTTEEIIKKNLSFLLDNYEFIFEKKNEGGNYYIFSNKYGSFGYYEWAQFDDSEFFVKYNSIYKRINLIEYYPKIVANFTIEHKGIRWLFADTREDFWKMVSWIVKEEIKNKNTIFGLRIH